MGLFATWRHTRAVKLLRDDLEEVREAFSALERKFKAIESEWDDTYDKIRQAMGRIVKRAAVIEKAAESADPGGAGDPGLNGAADNMPGLSQHQRAIQQDILRKRARL